MTKSDAIIKEALEKRNHAIFFLRLALNYKKQNNLQGYIKNITTFKSLMKKAIWDLQVSMMNLVKEQEEYNIRYNEAA